MAERELIDSSVSSQKRSLDSVTRLVAVQGLFRNHTIDRVWMSLLMGPACLGFAVFYMS